MPAMGLGSVTSEDTAFEGEMDWNSDKPSDNDPRQRQTEHDALRQRFPPTCGNPTQPDGIRRNRHAW